jgi:hypothetical protein
MFDKLKTVAAYATLTYTAYCALELMKLGRDWIDHARETRKK